MKRLFARLSLAVLLVSPCNVLAQLRPEVIQKAREAIVQVEVDGIPERVCAFAIDQEGRFVTTAGAILTPLGPPDEVQLTIDLGATGRKRLMARVRRVDTALGLAWLDLDAPAFQTTSVTGRERATLELGNDTGLVDGQEVAVLGFPLVARDAAEPSVQTGRVVMLEREGNRLIRFGIDAPFKRDQVGGPVLDLEWKVVGVIAGPRPGANGIAAVPVSRVATFLSVPVIRQGVPSPRSIPGELVSSERTKPQELSFSVELPRVPSPAPVEVDIVIEAGPGDRRVFPAKGTGGSGYSSSIVLVPAGERSLVLTVERKSGAVQGQAMDRELRAGERVLRLGDVRHIAFKRGPKAETVLRLNNQETIRGPISGLAPLTLIVDTMSIPIDLDRAMTIDVSPGKELPAPATIGCTVLVRQGKVELGRRSFPLWFRRTDGGRPANRFSDFAAHPSNLNRGLELETIPSIPVGARGAGASIRHPPSPQNRKTEISLAGAIGDVVTGGGGRFLLLVLRENRKLAVFDVNEARIVGHIPLPYSGALVAAGAETALIFDPESKLLESWDLKTRARSAARPFLTNCRVKNITLGSDSDGPLLVYWELGAQEESRRVDRPGLNNDPAGFFSLIDPKTLRIACFRDPNRGPVVDGPAAAPEPGEARNIPMASRIRFIPGLQTTQDTAVYPRDHVHHVRASPDGRTFGIWGGPSAPRLVLVFDKKTLQCFDLSAVVPTVRVVPGPAAGTIFSTAGVFDTQGQRRLDEPLRIFLPSNDPATFLAIGGFQQPDPSFLIENQGKGRRSCDIYLAGKTEPVTTLDNLEEMNAPLAPIQPTDLTLDKRFHYIPAARLLITIPASNDWLVLRHLDVLDRLPKVGLAN
jgi:Trypsin-like peptidase domain